MKKLNNELRTIAAILFWMGLLLLGCAVFSYFALYVHLKKLTCIPVSAYPAALHFVRAIVFGVIPGIALVCVGSGWAIWLNLSKRAKQDSISSN